MKEMAAGLFEEQEWEEEEKDGKDDKSKVAKEGKGVESKPENEDEVTTITGINPPVRRDNLKSEKDRRKQKLKKQEV